MKYNLTEVQIIPDRKKRPCGCGDLIKAFIESGFKVAEIDGFEDAGKTYTVMRQYLKRHPEVENVSVAIRQQRLFIYRKDRMK